MTTHRRWFETHRTKTEPAHAVLHAWLGDAEVQAFVGVNRYQGVLWFHRESFEHMLTWMLALAAVEASSDPQRSREEALEEIAACYEIIETIEQAVGESDYRVEKLLDAVK